MPTGQAMHALADGLELAPAAHGVQPSAPSLETKPDLQATQAVRFAFGTVPAGHGMHDPPTSASPREHTVHAAEDEFHHRGNRHGAQRALLAGSGTCLSGHGLQTLLPGIETVDESHVSQVVRSADGTVPAGQSKQSPLCPILPAGHGWQAPATRYLPSSHRLQRRPSSVGMRPGGQLMQWEAVKSGTIPAGHAIQAVPFAAAILPASHAVHVVAFAAAHVPFGQRPQPSPPGAGIEPPPQLGVNLWAWWQPFDPGLQRTHDFAPIPLAVPAGQVSQLG